jgi:hypothetical protein
MSRSTDRGARLIVGTHVPRGLRHDCAHGDINELRDIDVLRKIARSVSVAAASKARWRNFARLTKCTCILKTRCLPWRISLSCSIDPMPSCAHRTAASLRVRVASGWGAQTLDAPVCGFVSPGLQPRARRGRTTRSARNRSSAAPDCARRSRGAEEFTGWWTPTPRSCSGL